ncbi:DUF2703 domain-containing protein [Candidatus Gottesmanbacteria bacterium]|nr:DUF2703 domain-containing protein [Candidatus Gottesmanbacteria bacterium]
MKIQLLHTADCHAWKESLSILEEALKTKGLAAKYEVILIDTEGQAKAYKFNGSPSILIDGIDVDPMARNVKSYSVSSCRPYFYHGKTYDYPPKEMIIEALTSK